MNEKLQAARLEKLWTVADVCRICRVAEKSYRRWEKGEVKPNFASIKQLCQGFGLSPRELGFGDLAEEPMKSKASQTLPNEKIPEVEQSQRVSGASSLTASIAMPPSTIMAEQSLTSPPISGNDLPVEEAPADCALGFSIMLAKIVTIVHRWQKQVALCMDLQQVIHQELTMSSSKDSLHNSENYHISRRNALLFIAALPTGILTLSEPENKNISPPEELLPSCAASLTACWHLMNEKEFLAVEHSLAYYLPILGTLARQSSPSQKTAACLASQSYFLMSHLAMHRLHFKERASYCQVAAEYGKLAENHLLYVSALATLADAHFQLGHLDTMLQTYQLAAQYLDKVPAVLKSKVLGGLAHAYAQQGQTQLVLRYLKEAQIIFSAEPEEVPLFLTMDYGPFQAIQYEGQALLDLGDISGNKEHYRAAAESLAQVQLLPSNLTVPERIQIEIINQQAQVAIKMGDLEQFHKLSIRGVQGAKALQSEKRQREVVTNWKDARKAWPHEIRVLELADLLV